MNAKQKFSTASQRTIKVGTRRLLTGVFLTLERLVPVNRFESVLDLVDGNLELNKKEVLLYIKDHAVAVREELESTGTAKIPTSAGTVILEKSAVYA